MFRLPDAKRVRREDLYDSSSDDGQHAASLHEEDNAAARAKLNAHLASLLRFDNAPRDGVAAGPSASAPERDGETAQGGDGGGKPDLSDPEQEFEFRLFASDAAVAPKVVLESKTAVSADDAAMVSLVKRPLSYYIAAEPSAAERAMFLASAVSGEDVLRHAGQRTWGTEMPWRVTRLTASRKEIQRLVAHLPDGLAPAVAGDGSEDSEASVTRTRKRPGKKRRIALRIKTKAKKEKQEADLKHKISKEEHLREKKKRLNAQRRGKRRQKEKEKKMAAKAGGDGSVAPALSVQSDGSADSE